MTSFTPLWYGLLAAAAKAGVSDLDSLVLFGRLLSLVSLFGLAALGYLWNRRLGFSRWLALLSPAFLLSFPVLIPWAVTARPDFTALFLALLALYCVGLRSTPASTFLAGVLVALAFLTKHNTVAVAVAIVLWLLWYRRWKLAALFCGVWVLVVVSVLLPFQMSSGGLLLLNLSGAKFGLFALTYVRDVLARLFTREGCGFAVALFTLGAFGFIQSLKDSESRSHLVSVYFIISLGLAILGTAAAGGGINHYFEPALAMSLLIPVGMNRLQTTWPHDSPLAVLTILMTVALLLPSLDVQRWNAMHKVPEDVRPFASMIQNRRVFTDDPYLAARLAGPQAIDLSSLTNTEKRGGWAAWSSASIAKDLRERKYELVILRTPMRAPYVPYNPIARYPRTHRLDSAIQNAIIENYSLCLVSDNSDDYGQLSLYRPRPLSRDLSDDSCPSVKDTFLQHSFKSHGGASSSISSAARTLISK
jgi:hypothetical protein